ncbi:MAG: hypothetical protein Q8P76_02420 [bacterium]|nr:hypothetical protein [bacterium]
MTQEERNESVGIGRLMLFWLGWTTFFAITGVFFKSWWFFIPSALCSLRLLWLFGSYAYKHHGIRKINSVDKCSSLAYYLSS